MTLDSTTFYGFIVAVVVSIVGFMMEKQDGKCALIEGMVFTWQFRDTNVY